MNEYGALVEWYWQGINRIIWRNNCSSDTLSAQNPTYTALESNLVLCGERIKAAENASSFTPPKC